MKSPWCDGPDTQWRVQPRAHVWRCGGEVGCIYFGACRLSVDWSLWVGPSAAQSINRKAEQTAGSYLGAPGCCCDGKWNVRRGKGSRQGCNVQIHTSAHKYTHLHTPWCFSWLIGNPSETDNPRLSLLCDFSLFTPFISKLFFFTSTRRSFFRFYHKVLN